MVLKKIDLYSDSWQLTEFGYEWILEKQKKWINWNKERIAIECSHLLCVSVRHGRLPSCDATNKLYFRCDLLQNKYVDLLAHDMRNIITRRKPCLKILLLYRAFSRLLCFLLFIIILSSNFLLYYEHEMQRNLIWKSYRLLYLSFVWVCFSILVYISSHILVLKCLYLIYVSIARFDVCLF